MLYLWWGLSLIVAILVGIKLGRMFERNYWHDIKGPLGIMTNDVPNHYCAESCGDDPHKPAEESGCLLRRAGKCPEDRR